MLTSRQIDQHLRNYGYPKPDTPPPATTHPHPELGLEIPPVPNSQAGPSTDASWESVPPRAGEEVGPVPDNSDFTPPYNEPEPSGLPAHAAAQQGYTAGGDAPGHGGEGVGTGQADIAGLAGGQPAPPRPAVQRIPETVWRLEMLDIGEYDEEEEREWEDPPDLYHFAPAYAQNEPSSTRMAYLQAIINNTVNNMPVKDTDQNLAALIAMLKAQEREFEARLAENGVEVPLRAAPTPVVTVTGARRRLGLDADQHIIPYAACPVCWKLHTPAQMQEMDSPKCTVPNCDGEIYEVQLIPALRRMMRRKGFAHRLRDSRNTPMNQNDDPNFKMTDMHDGEIWHDLKTNIRREVGDQGTVRDVECEGGAKRLTENRYGLHITINIDWFGSFKHTAHSSGPIYIAFADLPREERYLSYNVLCICITPGPSEPTNEQLCNVMEYVVRDVGRLKQGVTMEVCDDDDTELKEEHVHGDCHKYHSRKAPPLQQAHILKNKGVRWSALDWLPGWRPCKQAALDFMHCIFLGVVDWLYQRILFAAHMFPGDGGDNSPKQRFIAAMNSIQWPGHITRFPKNFGDNQNLKKADEWQHLLTITPVLLWLAWRTDQDTIPDTEPPVAPNENITTTHCRRPLALYNVILLLCTAIRLLSTKTITMAQAMTGQAYFAQYCLGMLALGVLLSPNHHLAMHLVTMIKLFGLVYAWWLFPFERFNGMLEKVNLNGQSRGRVEQTQLRNWVRNHLLYELLLSLPADVPAEERSMINQIITHEAGHGSMAVELARFCAEASVDNVSLPRQLSLRHLDLHKIQLEGASPTEKPLAELLFIYCHGQWPQLRRQFHMDPDPDCVRFHGAQVARHLRYVWKDGIRYGCRTNSRTHTDMFAFISGDGGSRVPIVIEDLFLIKIEGLNQPAHVCMLIRRMVPAPPDLELPWQAYSTVLGIHVSLKDEYNPYEIIPASAIVCPLALVSAKHHTRNISLWITISLDHAETEPETMLDE
ncbi:hypothetical protein NMY22_g15420 [Coprinellus aureogranulatus]|nr:hypothetical protein NMY22_g15420 [Coprinellus aureogranulatus]